MSKNQAKHRLSPTAREDMEIVWLYSLNQWGIQQADRYVDGLTDAFTFLAASPKTGATCDDIRQGYRRHIIIRHVIYYRETDYGIEIMRILHDRMLASRHL